MQQQNWHNGSSGSSNRLQLNGAQWHFFTLDAFATQSQHRVFSAHHNMLL